MQLPNKHFQVDSNAEIFIFDGHQNLKMIKYLYSELGEDYRASALAFVADNSLFSGTECPGQIDGNLTGC